MRLESEPRIFECARQQAHFNFDGPFVVLIAIECLPTLSIAQISFNARPKPNEFFAKTVRKSVVSCMNVVCAVIDVV